MNVRTAASPIHGIGVFANEAIDKDDWQYVYGDLRIIHPGDHLEGHCVEWDDEKTFVPFMPWFFCNHSDVPNCEISNYEGQGDVLIIETLRDIDLDEELTIQYDSYVDWIKWKPVVGHEGIYEISDQGLVRSLSRKDSLGHLRKEKILSLCPGDTSGHLTVGLTSKEGVRKRRYVHQLVLESFVSLRPRDMQACHNDGDATNNCVANLRWDTPSNNSIDKQNHGTQKFCPVQRSDGVEFPSIKIAGEETGCCAGDITRVCQHKMLTAGGYSWEYI